MRRYVLLMSAVVFTLCLCNAYVWADVGSAPEKQPEETVQAEQTPVINKPIEEGELKQTVSPEKVDTSKKEKEVVIPPAPVQEKTQEQEQVQEQEQEQEQKDETSDDDDDVKAEAPLVRDPLQPYNRAIFAFNDKAFHYFIKPIYTGYNSVVPEKARVSVRNFFTNIKMPVRFFNCIFQGEFKGAGTELSRFVINSTIGIGGLFDPAKSKFHMEKHERDFGQTLAKGKVKSGVYIVWPFLGPSTVRDTAGLAGDAALNPLTWISFFFLTPIEGFGSYAYDTTNDISLDKGQTYESVTKPAIDPYIALQDAYIQNRIKKINE